MKRFFTFSMALTMALTLFTGCTTPESPNAPDAGNTAGAKDSFTVGYVNLADSDVFAVARKDALIAATKDSNIKVEFSDANGDIQKQLDQADNFIAKGVDLLVLVPVDYAGITPAVEKANEKGIPVICLGIMAEGGDYVFVGSENYDAGVMQGDYMAQALPKDAKILYLAGTAGMSHSTDRRNGFNEALAKAGRSDVTVLADLDGNYEMAKGMQITEDWIQSFKEFDGIIAANDQMALGAIEALKAANRLDGVLITGVDGTTQAKDAVVSGAMAQTVLQNAPGQAEACKKAIETLLSGGTVEKEIIVPFESITSENVTNYLN